MISVLLNWLYILFTTIVTGYGFSKFADKKLHFTIERYDTQIAAGLVIVTVYAQIFSLFYKVGLAANLILTFICLVIIILYKRELFKDMRNYFHGISVCKRAVTLFLIVFWAYFTSRGYMHYDSDLYHAQSIRWLEEYGIVKGLGNLHVRLAYNSSFFAVSALYSMKFLVGQSLHTVNGFMALLLSASLLDIMDSFKRRSFSLSDFARIAAVYYLTLICDEVVAPASDYAAMCTVFYIIIKWLDAIEGQEKNITPYALLCVGGVYTVSLKLTAGLILILLAKPAYMLIKERRAKEIVIYLSMGTVVILPWLIRNVIISGYLIYPYPELDIFQVDWKIPSEAAALDAAEIKTWGRAIYNAALVDMPVKQWFKNWFMTSLSSMEKLLIAVDLGCILISVLIAVYVFIRRKWQYLDYLLVVSAIAVSYMFWQLSAPLTRYGYAYILLLIAVVLGGIQLQVGFDRLVYYGAIFIGVVKLILLLRYAYGFAKEPLYVRQKDYGKYEAAVYEINGEEFYYPVYGDRMGYDYFPSSPMKKDIGLLGGKIKDGFKNL